MTIEEGKKVVDAGGTLELDLPARSNYLPANYHVSVNQKKHYTYTVHYGGEASRRTPLFASADWADFFRHLPPVLQYHNGWVVM